MRAVIQRVVRGAVSVAGDRIAEIGVGFVVLLGIAYDDGEAEIDTFADKLVGLRVFADEAGKMNRSVLEVGGEVLLVSQFTLMGSVTRGRRPSFTAAASPEHAEPLVERTAAAIAGRGVSVATGRFGAMMSVELVNDGPVTLILDVVDGKVL